MGYSHEVDMWKLHFQLSNKQISVKAAILLQQMV